MTVNMNNVYVTHKGREVSIAQHRHKDDWVDTHEIAVIPESGGSYDDFSIMRYGYSLDSLINRLMEMRDEIDKAHIHKPSGEGNATAT